MENSDMIEVVTFTSEDGVDYEMEVVAETLYKEKNYCLLSDPMEEDDSLLLFEVRKSKDGEEFIPITDEALESELISEFEKLLYVEEE